MSYYCITISPTYKFIDVRNLHRIYTNIIIKYCNKFSKKYALYPEFDSNSRLHYHGLIYVHDIIKMHKCKYKFMKAMTAFIKYDKIKNYTHQLRCLIYSMKDWPVNREEFNHPVMYTKIRRKLKVKEPPKVVTIFDYYLEELKTPRNLE